MTFRQLGQTSKERDASTLRPILAGATTPTSTVDHGTLLGLGDDDHAQYVHVSAPRTITAQHIFAPSIAQAPFVLGANAQGQLVAGLNADLLDGFSAAAFASAAIVDESYVVLAATGDLANERVLTGTANQVIITDGGAGGAVTLSLPQNIHTGASPTFVGLTLSGNLAVDGGTITSTKIDDISYSNWFVFRKRRTTGGILLNADQIASLIWRGYDGAAYVDAAAITAEVDGVPGSGDMPGRIVFRTTPDGSSALVNRWRITAAGILQAYTAQSITTAAGALTLQPAAGSSLNIVLSTTGDLVVNTDDLVVDTSAGRVGIGTAAPGDTLDVVGNILLSGAARSILTSGSYNLTLAPGGDLLLNPTGNDVLPTAGYDINLGSLAFKYLTLHAAELWVETLVAQNTIATIGGRILVGPTTILTADLAPAGTSISVKHNQMAVGDIAYLEANGQVEFIRIETGPTGVGPYTYTVTRNLDGSGANQWYAGDALFNTGTTGDGFMDLYSVSGVLAGAGPTIVGNVRNSNTYNDWDAHWAIGNLNGLYGYASDTYGVALGEYAATVSHLTIDSTDGIRFFSGTVTIISQWTGSTITIGPTSLDHVVVTSTGIQLKDNTVVRGEWQTDGDIFIGSDISLPGLTYLAIFAGAQTYNGEAVSAGDMLIGDNSASKANIFWDKSAGQLVFRGGTTAQGVINTDGTVVFGGFSYGTYGNVQLNSNGLAMFVDTAAARSRSVNFVTSSDVVIGQVQASYDPGVTNTFNLHVIGTAPSAHNTVGLFAEADATYIGYAVVKAYSGASYGAVIDLTADSDGGATTPYRRVGHDWEIHQPSATLVGSLFGHHWLSAFLSLPALHGLWVPQHAQLPGSGSNSIIDITGQGRHLSISGSVGFATFQAGLQQPDLEYVDLTGGNLNRADESGLDAGGYVTFGGWFWLDTTTAANQGIIGKANSTGNQRSYRIFTVTNTSLRLGVSADGITDVTLDHTTTITTGQWFFIVGRMAASGERAIFSLDANRQLTKVTSSTGTPATTFNSTAAFEIGTTNGATLPMDGRVGTCFLCFAWLSDATIFALYEISRQYYGT